MTKRSWVHTPTMETIFSGTIHIGSKLGTKLWKTLTWHCCMCCNPANGRVDFEEWSAYKIQLHGIEWIVSLSTDWDQSPTKKNLMTLLTLMSQPIFYNTWLNYENILLVSKTKCKRAIKLPSHLITFVTLQ
jgi:hypothetical protein